MPVLLPNSVHQFRWRTHTVWSPVLPWPPDTPICSPEEPYGSGGEAHCPCPPAQSWWGNPARYHRDGSRHGAAELLTSSWMLCWKVDSGKLAYLLPLTTSCPTKAEGSVISVAFSFFSIATSSAVRRCTAQHLQKLAHFLDTSYVLNAHKDYVSSFLRAVTECAPSPVSFFPFLFPFIFFSLFCFFFDSFFLLFYFFIQFLFPFVYPLYSQLVPMAGYNFLFFYFSLFTPLSPIFIFLNLL